MEFDDIEMLCPRCNGTGEPSMKERETWSTKCHQCRGHGTIPTDKGEALLAFLKKHLKGFVRS